MVRIRTTEKAAERQHPHGQRIDRRSSSHKRKTRDIRRSKKPSGTRGHQGYPPAHLSVCSTKPTSTPSKSHASHAPFFEPSKDLQQSLVSNRERQVVRHNPPVSFKTQNAWLVGERPESIKSTTCAHPRRCGGRWLHCWGCVSPSVSLIG